MRKLVYYVACSVDGFIAREDGSFADFPTTGPHIDDIIASFPDTVPGHVRDVLGVHAENRWFDTVLMGRRTYEVGLQIGVTSPYPHLEQYVFSRTMDSSPDASVRLVSDDALAAVKSLKTKPGKDIWLCGGGDLAAKLFPEIDWLILKVNPILLGSGISLFAGGMKKADLELKDSKLYGNGVMRVHYRVAHAY